jgi:hypothetical protein
LQQAAIAEKRIRPASNLQSLNIALQQAAIAEKM